MANKTPFSNLKESPDSSEFKKKDLENDLLEQKVRNIQRRPRNTRSPQNSSVTSNGISVQEKGNDSIDSDNDAPITLPGFIKKLTSDSLKNSNTITSKKDSSESSSEKVKRDKRYSVKSYKPKINPSNLKWGYVIDDKEYNSNENNPKWFIKPIYEGVTKFNENYEATGTRTRPNSTKKVRVKIWITREGKPMVKELKD